MPQKNSVVPQKLGQKSIVYSPTKGTTCCPRSSFLDLQWIARSKPGPKSLVICKRVGFHRQPASHVVMISSSSRDNILSRTKWLVDVCKKFLICLVWIIFQYSCKSNLLIGLVHGASSYYIANGCAVSRVFSLYI